MVGTDDYSGQMTTLSSLNSLDHPPLGLSPAIAH